jgi:hypothetical protein
MSVRGSSAALVKSSDTSRDYSRGANDIYTARLLNLGLMGMIEARRKENNIINQQGRAACASATAVSNH